MEKEFALIIIILGTAVVLPIVLVALSVKQKIAIEKVKKDIILAALEKNATMDVQELVKKLNKPDKLLKEKLLKKLQWCIMATLLGVGMLANAVNMAYAGGAPSKYIWNLAIMGAVFMAIGISFGVTYVVGKKMLTKEMELEEQNMQQS